jgi:hypothetical protein
VPHVFVLPEDEANRRLANEFNLRVDQLRNMQVLPEAGGWAEVLDLFATKHVAEMHRWPHRFMILIIDFDSDGDRLRIAKDRVPRGLRGRVFILGAWSNPEVLRARLGPYETIGLAMANDCRDGTSATWEDEHLQHNAGELDRLREHIVPILFSTT